MFMNLSTRHLLLNEKVWNFVFLQVWTYLQCCWVKFISSSFYVYLLVRFIDIAVLLIS